ncbi:MAG: VOC family protein [Thermomicrobiales bacterium]
MNDSEQRQHTNQTQRQLTHTRPTKAPLLRRTFLGWLGLAAGLGLSGTARGSVNGNQQVDGPATEAAGTSASEANSGTIGPVCIGIFVRDLPESLNFYRRLGLAIPEDAGGGYDYRLRLPTGQVFFWETYEAVRAFDPNWQPSSGNRRAVLEFGFATAQALDDKYAELTSAGYEGYLAPFTFSNSTVRYALIKDPDGNEIGLRYPKC